jgi:phospholipase D1/2
LIKWKSTWTGNIWSAARESAGKSILNFRLKIKKIWKKVRGKELNEEKEKDELRKKFILEHLNSEQRDLFEKELLEAELDEEDDGENDPKFEIVQKLDNKNKGTCKWQVLRSSDNWSTGIKTPESSIMNAYIDAIKRSKKFIYIENQFFISNPGGSGLVKNTIAEALKNRIHDAALNNEPFMVIVFIPLMPGFEGDVLKSDSAVLKTQIKYQQETISKGSNSLISQLESEGIDTEKYIRFYGLRQHDLFNNVPKQEIIYIHSKLMIVDDRKIIIGSANINDRSMLGVRDSEIAVLIEDEDIIESKMNGETFGVGRMPHLFRSQLYMGKQ